MRLSKYLNKKKLKLFDLNPREITAEPFFRQNYSKGNFSVMNPNAPIKFLKPDFKIGSNYYGNTNPGVGKSYMSLIECPCLQKKKFNAMKQAFYSQ